MGPLRRALIPHRRRARRPHPSGCVTSSRAIRAVFPTWGNRPRIARGISHSQWNKGRNSHGGQIRGGVFKEWFRSHACDASNAYRERGAQSGELAPELLLPAGKHDTELATAKLLNIVSETTSMDILISRARMELNQHWPEEVMRIFLVGVKLRPKRKHKNPIQAVAIRGAVANTNENLARLEEMEVERTNKARFRALNREKRAAKLPAAKEAGFETCCFIFSINLSNDFNVPKNRKSSTLEES